MFSVLGDAGHRAGRTSVVLALRGSRSQKVQRLELMEAAGYGYFAGRSAEEVEARVDTLIMEGALRFDFEEGLPLLAWTDNGLAEAKRYVVEEWREELRGQVETMVVGAEPEVSFLPKVIPLRNHDTALLLVDLLAEDALEARWLPLLRVWQKNEIKRVRARLDGVIAQLERRERAAGGISR